MPELPEVEIYRRYVERHAIGRRVLDVRVPDARILRGTTPDALARSLRDRRLVSTRRHGKHLFVEAAPSVWLYLHFGMTGDLSHYTGDETPRFAKVVLDFAHDRHLAFEDARLFGTVQIVDDPDAFIAAKRLGPDPLAAEFTLGRFRDSLRRRKGSIKAALMSQRIVAGLGNLYVDETLFQASIHPRRGVERLDSTEIGALYRAIRRILNGVIERSTRDVGLPRTWLTPRREEGAFCPRCGEMLARSVVAGRTTYHCPGHQH